MAIIGIEIIEIIVMMMIMIVINILYYNNNCGDFDLQRRKVKLRKIN